MRPRKLWTQKLQQIHFGDYFRLLSLHEIGKPAVEFACCGNLPRRTIIAYRLSDVNNPYCIDFRHASSYGFLVSASRKLAKNS
jgi:hypothetical protein